MKCDTCKKDMGRESILAAGHEFCSDICHLRFLKDEMPNLGGVWISEEMIQELNKLSGQERKDQYNEINKFMLDHMTDSPFFSKLKYSDSDDE